MKNNVKIPMSSSFFVTTYFRKQFFPILTEEVLYEFKNN